MLENLFEKICSFDLFAGFDELVESFGFPDWFSDALIDSIHILPFLFVVFVLIEFIEYFYSDRINSFMRKSEKTAPLIGSLSGVIPQCGFSVIASLLYVKRYITKGTLIAIYLATSDEALPILLANPDYIHYVGPVVGIKLFIGIFFGYLVDFVLKNEKYVFKESSAKEHEGCCSHGLQTKRKRDLIFHPVVHTLNIFVFILLITAVLNIILGQAGFLISAEKVKIFAPVMTAFAGLIPNCAISIALTMMLIKGALSFGAVMSGLLSNAGLGILVLLKHNSIKDTLKIVYIILTVSILTGYTLEVLPKLLSLLIDKF